ncbi:MAG: hypothetical protein JXB32_21910 [Deltaproteobacteria bacterium]|nr:hypothetical protein [Deltaproteobacteria bacterium]
MARKTSLIGVFWVFGVLSPGCGDSDTTPPADATDAETTEDTADVAPEDDAEAPEDAAEVEACVPTGPEVCDGLDNDCDGEVDEDFDLRNDDRNCGACGFICTVPGGDASCVNGLCEIEACTPGFLDLNGATFDGCEYECEATLEAESIEDGSCADEADNDCDGRVDDEDADCNACVPEFCDTLDNDCDGLTDEDFDLQSDPVHCGACGLDCPIRPHAVPACVRGECTFTCEAGWADADLVEANGCETRCTPSPTLDETACDGIDADCDGLVDEDYVPDFCGVGACRVPAVCWHGVEDCTPLEPVYDVDTVCDGIDQDCDGETDEEFVPAATCLGLCRDSATCVDGVETCGTPPAADDVFCDALDEDCDGETDEDYFHVPEFCGEGACVRPWTCVGGVEDCISDPASAEVCNGIDDDCDGATDNIADIAAACPPPAHVVATVCQPCGPGCGRCGIAPDGCEETFYDINGAYVDGCECQQEATEVPSASCPDLVRDLGDFSDDGSTMDIRGNIVPAGDVDWFRFRALDTDDTSCDEFHVIIEFTSNPGDAFRFDVHRSDRIDDCGRRDCEGESRWYDFYTDYHVGTGRTAVGECPCRPRNTSGYNTCDNQTQYYFVKVYRVDPTTTTCDSYTLRISNNSE